MIQVVCGIIWHEERVFIARRKEGKSLAGFWEFPGGKLETGELEAEALIRELEEELGMQVQVLSRVGAYIHSYENFTLNLIGFSCQLIKWNGALTDHDRTEWVLPEELINYRFAEADMPFRDKILKGKF